MRRLLVALAFAVSGPFAVSILGLGFVATRAAGADAASDAAAAEATKVATSLVERLRSKDVDERRKAIDEAAKNQHPLVTGALGRLLGEVDDAQRPALLAALVARSDDAGRKSAANAIASRLERIQKSDDDYSERQKLIASLHDLAEPSTMKALAAELGNDVTTDEVSARLRAIANLPCKEAVEEIIKFRSGGRRRSGPGEPVNRGRIARDAFAYAVGVDVGEDPDQMRKWWKEHEKDFDFKEAAARRAREGADPAAKRQKKGGEGGEPGMKPAGT